MRVDFNYNYKNNNNNNFTITTTTTSDDNVYNNMEDFNPATTTDYNNNNSYSKNYITYVAVFESIMINIVHYENMHIQIYWKFYHQKNENFQIKNSDIFHVSAQNIYVFEQKYEN